MAKVMVFHRGTGSEWYSRAGVITVRNELEILRGAPERKAGLTHWNLHRMVDVGSMSFKELRDE